jgi:hypothetical protein
MVVGAYLRVFCTKGPAMGILHQETSQVVHGGGLLEGTSHGRNGGLLELGELKKKKHCRSR